VFRTSTAPPRALLEPFPAGIDGPIADRHGSAARAPPLRVDPLLRSSSTQIDHGNGFLVSSSTFPTLFRALSPPLRAPHAPPFTMGARGWLLLGIPGNSGYTSGFSRQGILETPDNYPETPDIVSGESGVKPRVSGGWFFYFYYFSKNMQVA